MKKLYSLFIVFLLCFSVTQTFSQMTAPGNALDFAGDDDFVTVAPGVGAIPTSGDYTISLWAKHNALQAGTFSNCFLRGIKYISEEMYQGKYEWVIHGWLRVFNIL